MSALAACGTSTSTPSSVDAGFDGSADAAIVVLRDASVDGLYPPRVDGNFAHAHDDELRMNHIQMLATHNSYHTRTTPPPVPDWNYMNAPITEQLEELGIRGLELDVNYTPGEAPYLRVYHLPRIDEATTCYRFEDCLREIRLFSDAHPGHHPIFVQLEAKNLNTVAVHSDMYALMESTIRQVFSDDQLVTPTLVRGAYTTMREALMTEGWPTLSVARGRVMFAFDCGREECLEFVGDDTNLEDHVIFPDSMPTDDFAGVMIANGANDASRALVEQGFFVRVRSDGIAELLNGEPDELDAALATGAQIISTDAPTPREEFDYVASIPDGTPSRCSPVTAPSFCVSTDIEDPARIAPQ